MTLRFTVLASGSSGNSALIVSSDFALLLDAGLGPRLLSTRLANVGASWEHLGAVLLTHTHTDHWNDNTFAWMGKRQIALYCHASHRDSLQTMSPNFVSLLEAGLVHDYQAGEETTLTDNLSFRPIPLRHDGGATFGFRFSARSGLFSESYNLAYAADLGCWNDALVEALADVDLLALEFNHDVALQHSSGRSAQLIARVLGDDGHLSNEQAAALLAEVLRGSAPGRLRYLVQLHLSRQCNNAELARETALELLAGLQAEVEVHTAQQDQAGPTFHLSDLSAQGNRGSPAALKTPGSRNTARPSLVPPLPGMGETPG